MPRPLRAFPGELPDSGAPQAGAVHLSSWASSAEARRWLPPSPRPQPHFGPAAAPTFSGMRWFRWSRREVRESLSREMFEGSLQMLEQSSSRVHQKEEKFFTLHVSSGINILHRFWLQCQNHHPDKKTAVTPPAEDVVPAAGGGGVSPNRFSVVGATAPAEKQATRPASRAASELGLSTKARSSCSRAERFFASSAAQCSRCSNSACAFTGGHIRLYLLPSMKHVPNCRLVTSYICIYTYI